jgi:hypothetical protein
MHLGSTNTHICRPVSRALFGFPKFDQTQRPRLPDSEECKLSLSTKDPPCMNLFVGAQAQLEETCSKQISALLIPRWIGPPLSETVGV